MCINIQFQYILLKQGLSEPVITEPFPNILFVVLMYRLIHETGIPGQIPAAEPKRLEFLGICMYHNGSWFAWMLSPRLIAHCSIKKNLSTLHLKTTGSSQLYLVYRLNFYTSRFAHGTLVYVGIYCCKNS